MASAISLVFEVFDKIKGLVRSCVGTTMDPLLDQFTAITGADREVGQRMLEACNGNLEMAINMHVDTQNGAEASPQQSSSNGGPNLPTSSSVPFLENEDNVRAPIPPTREVLVERFHFGVRGRRKGTRSVFDGFRDFQVEAKRQEEEMWNAGSSDSKQNKLKTLEDLFRPPIDLIHKGTFDSARDSGKLNKKWLLVNIQNIQEFACQCLNRDVWSHETVRNIVQQHFVFWQVYHDSEEGERYMQFYRVTDWPYIAILDPRTGENLIVWNKIDAISFCDLAGSFVESHSLSDRTIEPPTQVIPPLKKSRKEESILDASEDAQMEAAIQASLNERRSSVSSDDLNVYDSDTESSLQDTASSGTRAVTESEDSLSRLPVVDSSTAENGAVWMQYLGKEDPGSVSLIAFRCPDGKKSQLSLTASSKLMALVLYAQSLGYSSEAYEIVTTYPKRNISILDPQTTLKQAKLFPRETVYIQAR